MIEAAVHALLQVDYSGPLSTQLLLCKIRERQTTSVCFSRERKKKMSFSRLRSNQRAVYRGSRRADIDTCSSLDRDKSLKNKRFRIYGI